MKLIITKLLRDENGFIVSAELILVATIAVLSLIVGLAEISHGVNQELEDVGSAVGAVQQSYIFHGLCSPNKAAVVGSYFNDERDLCDSQFDLVTNGASAEGHYGYDRD